MMTSSLSLFIFYLNVIIRSSNISNYMYRKMCVQSKYEAQLSFSIRFVSFMNAKMHKYASRASY
jgi:hypothetical protein